MEYGVINAINDVSLKIINASLIALKTISEFPPFIISLRSRLREEGSCPQNSFHKSPTTGDRLYTTNECSSTLHLKLKLIKGILMNFNDASAIFNAPAETVKKLIAFLIRFLNFHFHPQSGISLRSTFIKDFNGSIIKIFKNFFRNPLSRACPPARQGVAFRPGCVNA